MRVYPYSSAILLNDAIFQTYGGHIDGSLPQQRDAAYLAAEMAATEDLDTFLLPTIVTGTYACLPQWKKIMLDYGHVHQIYATRFYDAGGNLIWEQEGTDNINVNITSDTYGVISLDWILGGWGVSFPHHIQVVYSAGLPTGTANKPDILLALTTYADLLLQEIIGYGNEAPGDVGVQAFSNQQYSETRVRLLRTSFGTSARANFASQLLTKYRKRRWVGLGL